MKKNIYHLLNLTILGGVLLTGCGRDPVSVAIRAIEQGQLQNAEQILTHALQDDPANINALMNLSIVYFKNGRHDDAMAGFLQVAEQASQDPRPLEYAASIQIENNRWAEAAALLDEGLRRSPRSPSVQTAMAIVDLNTTGATAARDRLLKIIADTPAYAPALFNLGVINRDWLKNQSEGKKYFQRYLALEKNNPHSVIARVALTEKMRNPSTLPASSGKPQSGNTARDNRNRVKYF